MIFSLERAAVVWAILERISHFDPSLEMIDPRYLKFSTASSLFYLDLSLEAIWVVCHHFRLNSVRILSIKILINPSLDVVNINTFAKFDQILSIISQDIERYRNSDVNQGPSQLCYKLVKVDAL